jgi:NAD+ synthase (glutamine-hydrolysing)
MTKALGAKPATLTLENIQPRIRMSVLMAIANEQNRLLLNTSNKSELATGYSTLYGDSAGALAVLGDLTKQQVYALARHFNRNGVVIPERVIARAPSAELRENQTDQDSLPPYDVLDAIVKDSLENNRGADALKAAGHDPAAVDRFVKLYAMSEYKRQQFPPILRVSARAFGRGRRIPLASRKPWV